MSLFNFFKNLLWDDEIKDVVNLFFLIANLFITGLIYDIYLKGTLPINENSWYVLNNHNILEILLSFTMLLFFQSLCSSIFLIIGKISKYHLNKDIKNFVTINNRDSTEILSYSEKQQMKSVSIKMMDKTIKILTNDKNKFIEEFKFIMTSNGLIFFNKITVMTLTIIYFLSYIALSLNTFVVLCSIISVVTIIFNVYLVMLIEYKSLATELFGINELIEQPIKLLED